MTNTITVWVMEHDDPDVEFVINDEDDMRGNWEEGNYQMPFSDYCDTWTKLEMPISVWNSDNAKEWVRHNV